MVGSGLVTIPWAYNEAGFILGIFLTIVAFVISFTTQYFVMITAGTDLDYTDTLKKTFGKRGWYTGMIAFIGILTVPVMIFFQLLSSFLYPIILAISGSDKTEWNKDMDFGEFSYSYTCLIMFVLISLIASIKDRSIFIKINTYGVAFTIIIITFICGVGVYGLSSGGYTYVLFTDDLEEGAK